MNSEANILSGVNSSELFSEKILTTGRGFVIVNINFIDYNITAQASWLAQLLTSAINTYVRDYQTSATVILRQTFLAIKYTPRNSDTTTTITIIYVHCRANLFGYAVCVQSSKAFQHSCEYTIVQSTTYETKLVPQHSFRSVITHKLYHVTHTTMKIILQLRNVSVVSVRKRLTPFC